VRSGHLGDIRFVSLNATKRQTVDDWRGNPDLSGGGALFEAGVHWINFASNIGLDVEEVQAFRPDSPIGADRSSLVVFRYAGGAIGTLAHSWELPAPFGGLRLSKVQGTLGAVTFESNGLAQFTTGRTRWLELFVRDFLGYRAMFEDFLTAIATGARTQFTLGMAQRDLVLLEQAQRSMDRDSAARPLWRAPDNFTR
jgi:predicted dehydrogenase